jgi:hypothetical protein
MLCRSCGQEERASEGYPCKDCGTFICIMCVFKGVVQCERCAAGTDSVQAASSANAVAPQSAQSATEMDWPDH